MELPEFSGPVETSDDRDYDELRAVWVAGTRRLYA